MSLTLTTQSPPDDPTQDSGVTRAVIYLRVSSRGQLETDYDDDGLSIAAQRDRCTQKAAEYNAVVVDEYIERAESAKTDQRPELNAMLARIKEQRDVDYVILMKVDRFARNRRDDANMLFEIEMAGARLISATENIDQTPAGRLMHGMLASFAEYYSRNLATEVLKGTTEKAKRGGTPGRAPLGYRNIREQLPQGGEVRTVVVDEERGPIIRWAFETYATGLYSLANIALLLEARGLRSRGDRRNALKPLGLSRVHELLSNRYYAGIVSYRGKQYPGRHPKLISQELFDQVQAILHAHNLSGERDRKHLHYLKGSIRCICGSRLLYTRHKGNGGTYEYFVCPRYQRGQCTQGYRPIDLVETAVERHYKTVRLSEAEHEQVRQAIRHDLGKRVATAQAEIDRCQGVLNEVREQERKLLHMHYEDRITDELFDEEQARLKRERQDAETLVAQLNLGYDDITSTLELTLHILREDLHDLYQRADDHVRRLLNQAIFKALVVWDEDIIAAELAEPFAQLEALPDISLGHTKAAILGPPAAPDGAAAAAEGGSLAVFAAAFQGQHAKAPAPYRGQAPSDVGSISESMVGMRGLEPPRLNGTSS